MNKAGRLQSQSAGFPLYVNPIKSKCIIPLIPRPPKLIWANKCLIEDTMKDQLKRQVDYSALFNKYVEKGMPQQAEQAFLELKSPDVDSISKLMLCYAENGFLCKAQVIWDEMVARSISPFKVQVISRMFDAYCEMGLYEEAVKLVDELQFNGFDNLFPAVYISSITSLGNRGKADLVEEMVRKMASQGYPIDSKTGSALIKCHSFHSSLKEMERAYAFLKRSRCLLVEEGIRAMANAYIKEKKFYHLGEFLRDVGLRRRDVGNLLWNLLLLSYAGDFKMKGLQREFLNMVENGFRPDVTTFNIRMVAFCKMSLFWDLHLSLEHMKSESVGADLVTYGCVVDLYMSRRLGRNLDFAIAKMGAHQSPVIGTDPVLFDVLGKGDFQLQAESFLEYSSFKNFTYSHLVAMYVKKKYRSNQIFWNY